MLAHSTAPPPCGPRGRPAFEFLIGLGRGWVVFLVAVLYGGAMVISIQAGQLSLLGGTIWLPTGVGLAAVLIWGYYLLPLFVLVYISVGLAAGILPLVSLLGLGLITAAEIGFAAWWLCRNRGLTNLDFNLEGTARFALICLLVVPVCSAILVTIYLSLHDYIPEETLWPFIRNWWLSVSTGMLAVVPLAATWLTHSPNRFRNFRFQASAVLATLIFPTALIFNHQLHQYTLLEGMFYAALPLLFWVALFLRERGAASGIAIITIATIAANAVWPDQALSIWLSAPYLIAFGLMALFAASVQSNLEQLAAQHVRQTELERWAYRDALTGLANRHQLQDNLREKLDSWHTTGVPFAVVMIDLDDFKPVNDRYGHEAGDEVLRVLASRLETRRRPGDLMARIGGDEFVVILDNCTDLEQGSTIASRLMEDLSQPIRFSLPGQGKLAITVGISLGVTHVDIADIDSPSDLLRQADTALYQAKYGGKEQVAVYGHAS